MVLELEDAGIWTGTTVAVWRTTTADSLLEAVVAAALTSGAPDTVAYWKWSGQLHWVEGKRHTTVTVEAGSVTVTAEHPLLAPLLTAATLPAATLGTAALATAAEATPPVASAPEAVAVALDCSETVKYWVEVRVVERVVVCSVVAAGVAVNETVAYWV